jgi:hypothetical protein
MVNTANKTGKFMLNEITLVAISIPIMVRAIDNQTVLYFSLNLAENILISAPVIKKRLPQKYKR